MEPTIPAVAGAEPDEALRIQRLIGDRGDRRRPRAVPVPSQPKLGLPGAQVFLKVVEAVRAAVRQGADKQRFYPRSRLDGVRPRDDAKFQTRSLIMLTMNSIRAMWRFYGLYNLRFLNQSHLD